MNGCGGWQVVGTRVKTRLTFRLMAARAPSAPRGAENLATVVSVRAQNATSQIAV
jgi:hypothetical protein